MFRKDFQALAAARLREARVLLRVGMFDGAYYLGGLAVECSLKACISRATQRYEFPDRSRAQRVFTHNLESLLNEAGLAPQLRATEFVRVVGGRNGVLQWLRRYW